jgi:general secretion pathway protein N
MVERQVRTGLLCIAATTAAFATISLAMAADDPARFDRPDAELGRSLAAVPSEVPAIPLAPKDHVPPAVLRTGNPLWGIPLNALHATRERPLFSPTRRPPPPASASAPPPPVAAAPPPEPEQPELSLVGVVAGHSESFAVFISTTNHNIVRLRTGEGQDGWILRSVSGREAVLEKNNRTAVVELPPLTGDLK